MSWQAIWVKMMWFRLPHVSQYRSTTQVLAIRAPFELSEDKYPGYLVLTEPTEEEDNPLLLGKVGQGEIRIIQRDSTSNIIALNGGLWHFYRTT